MTITAFIFDLDGVIADTTEYHYRAWKQLADEIGVPFTRAENEQLRSLNRAHSLKRLLKGRPVPPQQFEEYMDRKGRHYRAFLEGMTAKDLIPGVGEFIRAAAESGLRLGVASSSRNARETLERLGLASYFEVVGDGLTVANPKPAPDIMLWVAGQLGAEPSSCVVFEDSATGVQAARAAGMATVGIGPAVDGADLRLPDFRGVTPAEVIRAVRG